MIAAIDGDRTGSFQRRLHWKWSLCGSERSECRGYFCLELDVLTLKAGRQRRRLPL